MIRHGDVLLHPVAQAPEGTRKDIARENGRPVLAYGEASGHRHVIVGECEAFTVADRRFIRMIERGDVVHYADAEHATVSTDHATKPVEPGLYEVILPHEYAYGEQRRVAD